MIRSTLEWVMILIFREESAWECFTNQRVLRSGFRRRTHFLTRQDLYIISKNAPTLIKQIFHTFSLCDKGVDDY